MATIEHKINFHVVFSGLNDFITDGGDYVVSDNTLSAAHNQVRTIDTITRSPLSTLYSPVSPLATSDIKFKWWDYREAEMWNFNTWDTSSKEAFANDLCNAIYNSIHGANNGDWTDVYGSKGYGIYELPAIDNLNVYICWGQALQADHINVMSDRLIFPFFYLGTDPESDLIITINEFEV